MDKRITAQYILQLVDLLKAERYDDAEKLNKKFGQIIKCWGWQDILERNKAIKDGSAAQRESWKGNQSVC